MTNALITARFDPSFDDRLRDLCGSTTRAGYGVTGRVMDPVHFREALGAVDVLITEFEVMDAEAFAAAPNLRALTCCRNEPHASVNIAEATARGIPVLFTPGRNARAVAEFTLGLVLDLFRGIAESHHALKYTDRFVSHGTTGEGQLDSTAQWGLEPGDPFDVFQGPELAGRTLGLVGCGAIGAEIAGLAKALSMDVIASDPYLSEERALAVGVKRVPLDEVASASDVVVIAAKVTPETRGMINGEFLGRMRRGSYLVNTARAAIVDYGALYHALETHHLRGAALDVHPVEPLPADSPFRGLDNVVLTPHLAGATLDVVRHHTRIALEDLERVHSGQTPRFCANPEVLNELTSAPFCGVA